MFKLIHASLPVRCSSVVCLTASSDQSTNCFLICKFDDPVEDGETGKGTTRSRALGQSHQDTRKKEVGKSSGGAKSREAWLRDWFAQVEDEVRWYRSGKCTYMHCLTVASLVVHDQDMAHTH